MKKTTFICPRCDRVYLEVSREVWDADRAGWKKKARDAKARHMCPWMRKKEAAKNRGK